MRYNDDIQLNIETGGGSSFYVLPRALFTMPELRVCSTEAKVLYAMLLDRSKLSRRNGWIDDQGRTFIYFTVDTAMELLNVCKTKAVKLFRELETHGLIVRTREFKAAKIYVRDIEEILSGECSIQLGVENPVESKLKEVEKKLSETGTALIDAVTGSENGPHKSILHTSQVHNVDLSHTEYIYTESAISSFGHQAENSESSSRTQERTDGRKAAEKKSFKPDIRKVRKVLADLKARCDYDSNFGTDTLDLNRIAMKKFTDTLLSTFTGMICHPSFITDENGEFVDADDSGYGYANYLKAQELKEKIAEHERHGGFFSWIETCFERWNGLVNAKQERGEPIRRKDRYFPKFLDSFLKGEYDLDGIDSAKLGAYDSRYAARSSFDCKKKQHDDYSGYFDVRCGRPFDMPDSIYTPFGRNKVSETKPEYDEWAENRAEEELYETKKRQTIDALMGNLV